MSTNANAYADFRISDKISFKSSLGTYFRNKDNSYYMASYAKNNGDTRGTYGDYQTYNWLNENVLTYENDWGNHNLVVIAGNSFQSNLSSTAYMDVSDFLTDEIQTLNAGTTVNDAYTTQSRNTLVSS